MNIHIVIRSILSNLDFSRDKAILSNSANGKNPEAEGNRLEERKNKCCLSFFLFSCTNVLMFYLLCETVSSLILCTQYPLTLGNDPLSFDQHIARTRVLHIPKMRG